MRNETRDRGERAPDGGMWKAHQYREVPTCGGRYWPEPEPECGDCGGPVGAGDEELCEDCRAELQSNTLGG